MINDPHVCSVCVCTVDVQCGRSRISSKHPSQFRIRFTSSHGISGTHLVRSRCLRENLYMYIDVRNKDIFDEKFMFIRNAQNVRLSCVLASAQTWSLCHWNLARTMQWPNDKKNKNDECFFCMFDASISYIQLVSIAVITLHFVRLHKAQVDWAPIDAISSLHTDRPIDQFPLRSLPTVPAIYILSERKSSFTSHIRTNYVFIIDFMPIYLVAIFDLTVWIHFNWEKKYMYFNSSNDRQKVQRAPFKSNRIRLTCAVLNKQQKTKSNKEMGLRNIPYK